MRNGRGDNVRTFLVTARKGKNFTHEIVAEKAGITRQYYGMIENGERTPTVPIAMEIGKVLDVDWTLFFDLNSNRRLRSDVNLSTS